ncbi:uncharacterized protein ACLA_085420 [Aspergillus clavatus NRRL 1]|uniref:Uncharacterized protein n=1 Tax=Aspergillus clavatus (strain ATCC 1007 / CBS 513.65 / DSM 816 / NCTC 3887 / NRRL 1 / QM 1276 / 107) TaxID=344612 RepID=A1CU60_ASPCL|nr:uncharacterized protein ACLA_085420 [Aspergillus clavatus NRRL 1]EAW06847.1 hypothetical protein ACLA_085420 [Aspergillus clavatus NRRL 1]
MSLRILRNSTLRYSLSPLLRASYHKAPEVYPTKGEDGMFWMPSPYPDDYEYPTMIKKTSAKNEHEKWDEIDATFSEAAIKADRGDVRFDRHRTQARRQSVVETDTEPNLHDM